MVRKGKGAPVRVEIGMEGRWTSGAEEIATGMETAVLNETTETPLVVVKIQG